MSAITPDRLRSSIVGLLDEAWQLLRQPMTSGQRQSALLLIPLTVALVLYGRPAETNNAASIAPEPPAVLAPVNELVDTAPTLVAPLAEMDSPASAPAPLAPPPASELSPPQPPAIEPLRIVAVVRPAAEGETVTDRDLAGAFLRSHRLTASIVELGPPDVCRDVLAQGALVLAGVGLGPALRACLVEGGATVVAYDALGDEPRGRLGPGEVLSTRRGFGDSVVELASWAQATDRLEGPVGLVTMESARALAAEALRGLEDHGVEVAEVAYIPDDDSDVAVSQGVIDFAASGVGTTIFATPVAVQRDWSVQSSLFSPTMTYLVADVFDAVIEAGYADGFAATALTALQFPWSPTGSDARADCDRTWADAGGKALSAGAAVRMYAWCQHVALAARTGASRSDAAALRTTTLHSPLTTRLGPLRGGRWGPTRDHAIVWDGSCTCWTAEGNAMDRTIWERG